MGIYRQDYILFGWKLSNKITNDKNEVIDFFEDKYLPYIEGHKGIDYYIINDQMCGKYTAFGKRIMCSNVNEGWNFETIVSEGLNSEEVINKYIELFGTNPTTKPVLFIFSNFS